MASITSSIYNIRRVLLQLAVVLLWSKCSHKYPLVNALHVDIRSVGGFNYEIEKRVHERVSELMNVPVTMLGLVEQYSQTDVFEPPFLRPHQKDEIFRFLWTVWREFNVDLYYGQEDGLFLGIIKGSGTYQEGRGSNGYMLEDSIDEISSLIVTEEDAYMKRLYYDKCLDPNSGAPRNCTLNPTEDFITCIDNCKPRPCSLSTVPSTAKTSDTAHISSSDSAAESAIYCPTYEISKVPEIYPMGYIPRYYYCLNSGGSFIENNPPNSVASPSKMIGGVCTHSDGVTLVDGKTVTKQTFAMADRRNYLFLRDYDYPEKEQAKAVAHSLHTDDPMAVEDNQKSDQIFMGGYHSRRYEPRLRPWYIGTREIQNAFWTKPYPFATNNDMGISFGKPVYYTDPSTGHKVFRGVICVDYDLKEISRFLVEVFLEIMSEIEEPDEPHTHENDYDHAREEEKMYSSNSGATVLIVEDDAPHYIIGSSTGSKAAKKVRVDDESIKCEDEEIFAGLYDCKTVRSTPHDYLNSSSTLDGVMALAFTAQKREGFPKELVVSDAPKFNKTGDGDESKSEFYVSQSMIYQQKEGENLRWRIIVAMPVEISMNDALYYGDPMFYVVLSVGIAGCVSCLVLFHFYFSKRNKTEVRMSDWRFTSAFILGCALLNLTTLTKLGPTMDQTCMLRMWSFHFLFVLALSPLLVKVWRIYKLVGSADRAVRLSITNQKAMLVNVPVIFLQVLILTLFSIFDPSKEYTYVDVDGSSSLQHSICKHKTKAFMITQLLFEGSMVLVGCILAFKTRNLSSVLGEAKQLLFAMYNVGLVAVIVMLMGSFLDVDQKSVFVIEAVGIFWATVFSSCAFVLPRLLQVQKRNSTRRSSALNTSSFYQNAHRRSASFHNGPLVVPDGDSPVPSGSLCYGGSLHNEPRSQLPNTSINSSELNTSDYELQKSSSSKKDNNDSSIDLRTAPLGSDFHDVVYDDHHSSYGSDVVEDLRNSDTDSTNKGGGERQKHRNTSFTKLSISSSQSEILQELAEAEEKNIPQGTNP